MPLLVVCSFKGPTQSPTVARVITWPGRMGGVRGRQRPEIIECRPGGDGGIQVLFFEYRR